MNIKIKNRIYTASVIALILICITLASLSVFADEAKAPTDITITQIDDLAPITVIADSAEEYGCRIGAELSVCEIDYEYFLFLPSTAELSEVKVRYNGSYKLYNPTDGSLYAKGSEAVLDFSGKQNNIYEYDEANKQYREYTLTVMSGENLSAIYITLDRGEDGLRNVNSRQWAVETGNILVSEASGKTIYNGGLVRFKGHGLTSYEGTGSLNTKNSYNINLESKAELIEGAGKSKKWTMLRIRTHGNYDATGVSYPMGFYTYDALLGSGYFHMTARFVDVYINGEYRGVYILTERMDMNGSMELMDQDDFTEVRGEARQEKVRKENKKDPAIAAGIESYTYCKSSKTPDDADITGGYVLEVMCGHYGEYGFKTKQGMYLNVKSPSYPTKEQVQYIAEYVQSFENALFSDTGYNKDGKHYTEYMDMRSYCSQALAYSFYLNWEIYRTSTYIHKDADGKAHDILTFGPAWDFETGPSVLTDDRTLFGTNFAYNEKQQYIWYQEFWKKADFMNYITSMVSEMQGVVNQLTGKETGNRIFSLNDMLNAIEASQNMNWVRWRQRNTFSEWKSMVKKGINARYDNWFNNLWNPNKYLLGGTVSVSEENGKYTLTAQAVGKASSYQWYKLEDNIREGTAIAGATDKVFTTSEKGIYYCGITGPNNAQWDYASGSTFKKKNITMYTDPTGAGETIVINTPDEYVLGKEPDTVAGLPVVGEYVYTKVSLPEETEVPEKTEETGMIVSEGDKGYIIMTVAAAVLSLAAVIIFGRKGHKNEK